MPLALLTVHHVVLVFAFNANLEIISMAQLAPLATVNAELALELIPVMNVLVVLLKKSYQWTKLPVSHLQSTAINVSHVTRTAKLVKLSPIDAHLAQKEPDYLVLDVLACSLWSINTSLM